jgi:diaminopimelate decarboxylase
MAKEMSFKLLLISKIFEADKLTPFYIFDIAGIKNRLNIICTALKAGLGNYPFEICYSYKSNSLPFITSIFKMYGCLADVVTPLELKWAIKHGFNKNRIIVNGPLNSNDFLQNCCKKGLIIQIDNLAQLNKLCFIKRDLGYNRFKVAFRLSSFYNNSTMSRFGLKENEIESAILISKKNNIEICGAHIHAGSNIQDPEIYAASISYNLENILMILNETKKGYLNLGGGFPSTSLGSHIKKIDYLNFTKYIANNLKKKHICEETKIIFELGRSLIDDFGFLVTKILNVKYINSQQLITVDCGLNFARSIPFWFHPISLLVGSGKHISSRIVGVNCYESDLISENILLHNSLNVDDLLTIGNVGSYDIMNYTPWNRGFPNIYYFKNEAEIICFNLSEIYK